MEHEEHEHVLPKKNDEKKRNSSLLKRCVEEKQELITHTPSSPLPHPPLISLKNPTTIFTHPCYKLPLPCLWLALHMKLELELAGTSSSSFIQTYSSSSSNSFLAPAPKMADGKGRDDTKLWPAALEKQLILILMLEETKGNIPNGQMKHNCWSDVVDEFNRQTNKPYSHQQIMENFKRLKKRYNAFSRLIGTPGIEWDRPTNTVRGPKSAWLEADSWNRKCKEFRNKGLEHFDMLVQLFKTGTASSAQPDSPDDVYEIPHPDMGQGSNRKGKLPVRSNTSTEKKRKTIDSIMEMEFSKKTHSEDRIVESTDPYSISKATEIVNSMFGGPLGRSTLFKFLLMLKTPTLRQTFITLQADMQEAFIEYCCGSGR